MCMGMNIQHQGMYTRLFEKGSGMGPRVYTIRVWSTVVQSAPWLDSSLCTSATILDLFAMHCILCTVYYSLHTICRVYFLACIELILHLCCNSSVLLCFYTFVPHLCHPFVLCTTLQVVCLPFPAKPCYARSRHQQEVRKCR